MAGCPAWLSGIIQGVLPQLMLVALTALLPLILRVITGWQGLSTETTVELSLQKCYFVFLFVQNFLTVSFSSSITAIAQDLLHGPTSAAALLARNLPKASIYSFSYLTLQGLSVSAGAFLQAGGLINWLVLAPWTDRTPRQKWERQIGLPEIRWGTFYPLYTDLACIGLIYSIIAPLILPFSVATFSLFWFVFRYNLLYVSAFPYDTGGQLYPTALKQLFTGVYTMELCLIGLFLSIRNDQGVFTGIGQAVIMMIATTLRVIYQLLLGNIFSSFLKYLPASPKDREDKGGESNGNLSAPALDHLRHLGHTCYGWMRPSKEVPQDLQESVDELARNELGITDRRGYKHEAADHRSPVVWIPKDDLGISEDEIAYARNYFSDIRISNEFADIDIKGRLEISQNVSDTDIVQ
ncbi:hypothetical protein N7G274_003125 [Stereocaulon virgatum]|uniref:DUF221-domain-containing protein n=1 Tax=Stereocaulon virgatum TaxID=373712 RepID=A0ABR4AF70_9LECA